MYFRLAVCTAISAGSARITIAALTELRAVLDSRSAERPSGGSSTSSTAKEGPDETSLPKSTTARITTLAGIADALNKRGVRTARVRGERALDGAVSSDERS